MNNWAYKIKIIIKDLGRFSEVRKYKKVYNFKYKQNFGNNLPKRVYTKVKIILVQICLKKIKPKPYYIIMMIIKKTSNYQNNIL